MSQPTVFEVHFDHPRRNALNDASLGWLEGELERAAGRPLLLSGPQEAFSAGLDLEHVARLSGSDPEGMGRFLRRVDALMTRLFLYPGPTVAAVDGHAIAGGCVLALACDHRIARDDPALRIGLNEVALGACYPPRILRLVHDRVPRRHLAEVVLGAGLFEPRRALEVGLVDELAGDARSTGRAHAKRLGAHPAGNYALIKRTLRGPVVEVGDEEQRRFEEEGIAQWTSPELRARVRAVLG